MKKINFYDFLDEIKDKKNKTLEDNAKENDYYASLWLADVKKFYENYGYNLGYIRKDAPARKNRPAIIIEKNNNKESYKIIFLTTSYGSWPCFDLKKCQYHTCKREFAWNDKAKIFSQYKKGKKLRKMFIIYEGDLKKLMEFCGNCSISYIEQIKKEMVRNVF